MHKVGFIKRRHFKSMQLNLFNQSYRYAQLHFGGCQNVTYSAHITFVIKYWELRNVHWRMGSSLKYI